MGRIIFVGNGEKAHSMFFKKNYCFFFKHVGWWVTGERDSCAAFSMRTLLSALQN